MPDWRPMSEFDPTKPSKQVHDGLNDTIIDRSQGGHRCTDTSLGRPRIPIYWSGTACCSTDGGICNASPLAPCREGCQVINVFLKL